MAGIYIHIPYCIQKCGYCDFYSIIRLINKSEFVTSLIRDIKLRKYVINGEKIETIYFGGGTPSLLKIDELDRIYKSLVNSFNLESISEITIEVNPDDVTFEYLKSLRDIGFNRLSMGIQSFNDKILTFMNRRHSSIQAKNAVNIAKKVGFTNISIDIIYGIPNMSLDVWVHSIREAIKLDIQHISAYHLTFEPNTPFYTKLKRNEIQEIPDIDSVVQYNILVEKLSEAGFIDYEISNFSKFNLESRHNSNYWSGRNYLGFGPSAHSYVDETRSWNISNLHDYIFMVNSNGKYYEQEELTQKDIFNESIMLGLRTKKGVDINLIRRVFDQKIVNIFNQELIKNISLENVHEQDGYLMVKREKKFLSDKIISNFFIL